MSTNRGSNSPLFPWPGFFLIAALSGGIWCAASPLVSHRPERTTGIQDISGSSQNYASRLWQDPFDVISGYRTNQAPERSSVVARQLALNDTNASQKVLLVMASGSAYAKNSEARLRSRRATVAALGANGYRPLDSEHLGIDAIPRADSNSAGGGDSGPMLGPFEWFESTGGPRLPKNIVVLWLNDRYLSAAPLAPWVVLSPR